MGGGKEEQTQNHRSKQREAETTLHAFHARVNELALIAAGSCCSPVNCTSTHIVTAEVNAQSHHTELGSLPAPELSTGIFTKILHVFYVLQRWNLKCYSQQLQ